MNETALLFVGIAIIIIFEIQVPIMNLYQFILSYLKYIFSQFPFNLKQFSDCFEFLLMNFIVKYFKSYDLFNLSMINENFNNNPLKVKQDDLTSQYIINSTSVIFIWLSLILIYIASKKITNYLHQLDFKYQ
ncbi:unnamed protein product [Paramecium pentaurelia]|uniref:Transmembrane protein n=1 Tax=Paramecium pentaurelia TaxID=43138 RepID=A0A8S1V693_9CILI|nr:unnamed protein product [Paramecium pentaurelia]